MEEKLIFLIFWHFLADFPFQGDYIAKGKNPLKKKDDAPWWWLMVAHCIIHATGVFFITKSFFLAWLEYSSHYVYDTLKCHGKLTFMQDQVCHLIMKFIYVAWLSIM